MARRKNLSHQTHVALLALLQQPENWRYGYDLTQETGLKSGTLYPILMRLHDQGLLQSEWQPSPESGRPPRHAYRLTVSGLSLAQEIRSASSEIYDGKLGIAT